VKADYSHNHHGFLLNADVLNGVAVLHRSADKGKIDENKNRELNFSYIDYDSILMLKRIPAVLPNIDSFTYYDNYDNV